MGVISYEEKWERVGVNPVRRNSYNTNEYNNNNTDAGAARAMPSIVIIIFQVPLNVNTSSNNSSSNNNTSNNSNSDSSIPQA